ncbi:MAG: helix-turn-helix domain-containing protein [Syntrophobacter sp.]
MRDHAVILYKLLREYRRISIGRIAEEMEISEPTARRWVDSFSCVFPIRMESGIVIVDKKLK